MIEDFLLTPEELEALTGYRRPSKQAEVLQGWGIRHYVARDGHPRVLRADVERPTEPHRPRPQPRLRGLSRHG